MSSRPQSAMEDEPSRRKPAASLEEREQQLVLLATDVVEKRMMAGTASAAEVIHYLKLGSTREKLEQQRLRNETALIEAKVQDLASQKRIEELYERALTAMHRYQGVQEPEPLDD